MKTERHTNDAPKVEPSKAPTNPNNLAVSVSEDGKEVYTSEAVLTNTSSQSESKPHASPIAPTEPPPPAIEEEDDLSIPVAVGTKCLRKGCGKLFVSDELNRLGDGEGTVCVYHPSPPIFREGSKGYLCCKRRVLEFDEFLKIEGCKTGRHVFAVKAAPGPTQTECRIEHYQTLDKVHVSIYAKKADKDKTSIKFECDKVILDILFQDTKRFTRTIDLVGPINADTSTFQIMGTKVELHLQKEDRRSWSVLEKSELVKIGNYAVTFGVGGRTGTIGGKEIILDASNQVKAG
ncbi:chord-domain-containing protein [Armillaria borealis]|uniref:Chord-domain-containing protein n=1 Tax=Armillaria borealis TaxID=47425 RepID=A0AA39JIC0_9AGAR|nr:chord-domain-containing protein [Armillaria borealis]